MKEHIFLPKPIFPRHICFPDFIGGYGDFPEHAVNREFATTENNLDRYYNLHIVLDGKGYLHTDSMTYELTQGQGFLYGPGLRQTYHSDNLNPWNIRWVHFYGARLEELLDGRGLDEPWLFHLPDLAPVEALMERLLKLGRSYEVDDEYAAASTLYELLARIQTTASQVNVSVHQAADKIRAAANYIRAHCNQPFTLEQAAAIAGYSSHYFSRKFNKTFGKSFSDFLTEARILRAKQLLASTRLSVKLIALETGFSQTSYFSKCFRDQEGMTPLQFREMHKT
ncbi:AraC-like DNA-binding protein [Paenibacillus sp. BK033]|uniref:helix-turn-helix domain-containing protein n=1 Tax=Paenibacillus sp. BK033 TaxID=2512133 RepID=UPI0010440CFC|nr:AraC family transcriptional regulator [Paenibacillus sp. BK033]TCM93055.1 AraC-like DNA-binding protein [Paenibacillus sp. BK033]